MKIYKVLNTYLIFTSSILFAFTQTLSYKLFYYYKYVSWILMGIVDTYTSADSGYIHLSTCNLQNIREET